jgi:Flp pilus assembly protein TadG
MGVLSPLCQGIATGAEFTPGQTVTVTHTHARKRIRGQSGATMVEFALVAPMAFVLLILVIVMGIVVTNYIQLTNVAREGARMAAICTQGAGNGLSTLPDGTGTCDEPHVAQWIANNLVTVPGSVRSQVSISVNYQGQTITNCQANALVEVDVYYDQPLYLPLITQLFETNSNGTRRLLASAQATCEQ